MFHRAFRHIKEGFIGVKRHLGLAFSSISAVMITLLLLGMFGIVAVNLAYLTKEIEKSISLVALIDYEVTDQAAINSIEKQILSISGIKEIEFRNKGQEFDFYNKTYPDMIEFSDIYREDNPFHDVYIIYVEDEVSLSSIKNEVARINGISSVEDGGTNTYILINILNSSRMVGLVMIGSLVLLAIYLIYNTINVTITSRKTEIAIMRQVGARNGYIRAPFLVEGIIIGFFGAIIPVALCVFGYYRLYQVSGGVLVGVINLLPVMPFVLYLALFLVVVGMSVGLVGSYISVCKSLRLTR